MSNLATKLFTFFTGDQVGVDQFGNKYYKAKRKNKSGIYRRWVIYNGTAEASKVPPEWHGWLHYTFDEPLKEKYSWQKDYVPNLTGTPNAYFPPGANEGKREKVSADYEAWKPGK